VRHIHWLKVVEGVSAVTQESLADHLRHQIPVETRIGVINWVYTMKNSYGGQHDENGSWIPLWKAWIEENLPGTFTKKEEERHENNQVPEKPTI
tara:strand:+ start:1439 stop:1720 length:282 start_codon:yes stop_codon:yes gene_type:complete